MQEQGIYADILQLIEYDVSGMKYSLGERKKRESAEAKLALHVYDTLIASMIIPPHYAFPARIYSCVQFSLCSSLCGINNLRKCAGTPRHTP